MEGKNDDFRGSHVGKLHETDIRSVGLFSFPDRNSSCANPRTCLQHIPNDHGKSLALLLWTKQTRLQKVQFKSASSSFIYLKFWRRLNCGRTKCNLRPSRNVTRSIRRFPFRSWITFISKRAQGSGTVQNVLEVAWSVPLCLKQHQCLLDSHSKQRPVCIRLVRFVQLVPYKLDSLDFYSGGSNYYYDAKSSERLNLAAKYDGSWHLVGTLLQPRRGHRSLAHGTTILHIGGDGYK